MNSLQAERRIRRGDIAALRRALAAGFDVRAPDRYGWTLLMTAAQEGRVEICRLLIDHGAPIDLPNKVGETALSLAAHAGKAECVRWLLASGAPKSCRPHGSSLLDWTRRTSGLPREQLDRIMNLIG
ncbi:hypothetical protein BH11PSE2_BH11PSE2_09570 [soil metagenome]